MMENTGYAKPAWWKGNEGRGILYTVTYSGDEQKGFEINCERMSLVHFSSLKDVTLNKPYSTDALPSNWTCVT